MKRYEYLLRNKESKEEHILEEEVPEVIMRFLLERNRALKEARESRYKIQSLISKIKKLERKEPSTILNRKMTQEEMEKDIEVEGGWVS